LNKGVFAAEILLSVAAAVFYYGPAFFLQKLVNYLEDDMERVDKRWGILWAMGLFAFNCFSYLGSCICFFLQCRRWSNPSCLTVTGQLWSLCSCVIQVRLRIQLNTVLFAKTLVRKDVASSAPPKSGDGITDPTPTSTEASSLDDSVGSQVEDEDFSSKAQIMTLMTTDVDRCSEFATHMFTLVGMNATSELIVAVAVLCSYIT
jgi:hypothetical protein